MKQIAQELPVRTDGKGTGFYFRFLRPDDFGRPKSSFVICSFWPVQAPARLNRLAEARQIMAQVPTGRPSSTPLAVSPPWTTVLYRRLARGPAATE